MNAKEKREFLFLEAEYNRRLAIKSLHAFAKEAWHIIEPSRPFVDGWHIQAICEHLEAVTRGDLRNLLINLPPRHMKSVLVCVIWPAWVWLKYPSKRWLFSSYAQNLSTRDSVACRNLIQSKWYQNNMMPPFVLSTDQNEKDRFSNNMTGYRIATSVGGTGTGESADIGVADDPHNMLEVDSPTIRRGVLDWFDLSFSTRGNDPKTYARVVIMQRGHENDVSGHILEKGGFEHLCLPAEYEAPKEGAAKRITSIGWSDPRTKVGELLWPAQFGPIELARLKTDLGSRGTAGQLQQRPAAAEGALIKLKWLKYYRELPSRFDEVIQSWDMTFKDNEDNDYVVGELIGRRGADKYLIDETRAIADFPTSVQMMRNFTAKHARKYGSGYAILVEDKANGPAIIATLKNEIPGIIAVNPKGSKISRLNSIAPTIEAGNFHIPDPSIAPWIGDWVSEVTTFPAGANDDRVDSTSQGLNYFKDKAAGDFSEEMVPESNTIINSDDGGSPSW